MQSAEMVRAKQLNIRLGESETADLNFIVKHHDISAAQLFRRFLKWERQRVESDLKRDEALKDRELYDTALGKFVRHGGDPERASAEFSRRSGSSYEIKNADGKTIAWLKYDPSASEPLSDITIYSWGWKAKPSKKPAK